MLQTVLIHVTKVQSLGQGSLFVVYIVRVFDKWIMTGAETLLMNSYLHVIGMGMLEY